MSKHPIANSHQPNPYGFRLLVLLGLAVVLGGQMGFAQSTNAPARLSYDSFRTISDRNIFNPNRYARRAGTPARATTAQPASRVESFSLVGVMAYEKGWFAFFDGSKDDYKQALQANEAIGEYQVAQVTPNSVKLALGTNTFDLKVGMQMRREDEGDWFLSEAGETQRRRAISTRTRTRGGDRSDSHQDNDSAEGLNGAEPEILVIAPTEFTEGVSPGANGMPNENGNGINNGDSVPEETSAGDNGGVTDPVLLRLMQRRQQMNQ